MLFPFSSISLNTLTAKFNHIEIKMQHLFFYIVFILSLFKGAATYAQTADEPFDMVSQLSEKYNITLNKGEDNSVNIMQAGIILYEIGKYFNEHYDDETLFGEDIIEELRTFFPHENEASLRSRASFLQTSLKVYRLGNQLYQKIAKSKLLPQSHKKVRSDSDYNHSDEVMYREAPAGEFYKVYNFKKFLTYSDDMQERKAIIEYERKKNSQMSTLDKIDHIFHTVEWKKALFYGLYYENPLLSKEGVSPYSYSANVQTRLLADENYINSRDELIVGLHVVTRLGKFIVANNFAHNVFKPKIVLQKTQNIASYEVLYPAPIQSNAYAYVYKYQGDFLILLKIKPEDKNKSVEFTVQSTFDVCNDLLECMGEETENSLNIAPYGDEVFGNGFANFIAKAANKMPQQKNNKLELKTAVVDNDENTQVVRLEFVAKEKVRDFQVFLEEKDGFTKFNRPNMSIHDNKIFVRFVPWEHNTYSLVDSEFMITAVLNDEYAIKTTKILRQSTLFDAERIDFSFMLVWLAFLGGFILNFMPCVFPVLFLKIMAFSRLSQAHRQQIKKSFYMSILGIFSGFTLIIAMLCAAKYAGYSLGWGMQFQNMKFLVFMSFMLFSFCAILPYVDVSKLYKISELPNGLINFATGGLVVLLSTPCTGPYLATAIGFALSGTYAQMIVLLYALAAGLAFPYLLAVCLKSPQDLFLRPGKWMLHVSCIMKLMLYATICWFLVLIYKQTDVWAVAKIIAVQMMFLLLFKLYLKFKDYLDGALDERYSLNVVRAVKKVAFGAIAVAFCVCLFWASHIADKAYGVNYAQNMQSRLTNIDYELIDKKLAQGRNVLLEIKADWCLTCGYNDLFVLHKYNLETWKKVNNLDIMRVDWTNYNQDVLNFMEKYGRKGLPFYILFTPEMRNGIVLPEIFSPDDLTLLLT